MTALAMSILYHFLISIPLVALVWAAGWMWLSVLRGKRGLCKGLDTMLYAYPIGLLFISLASVLILLDNGFRFIGIALLFGPLFLAGIFNVSAPNDDVKVALRSLIVSLPFVFVFTFVLGVKWHGPTAGLAGSPLGDTVVYVARLYSLKASLVPYRDLLVEGINFGYASSLPSLIGAVLAYLPGFDAFLFYAVTCPAFFLLSVCLGISFWNQPHAPNDVGSRTISERWILFVFLFLLLSSVAYPSWVVESPPVAFAIPLSFGVFHLAHNSEISTAKLLILSAVFLICTFLTKVFAIIPFAAILGMSLVMNRRDHLWMMRKASLTVIGIGLVLVAAYSSYMLASYQWIYKMLSLQFLPVSTMMNIRHSLPSVFAILGQVLLMAYMVRTARNVPVLLALALSVLSYWILPSFTDIAVGVSVLMSALLLLSMPSSVLLLWRLVIVVAAVLLLLSALMRELTGNTTTLILLSTMGLSIVTSLRHLRVSSRHNRSAVQRYLLGSLSGASAFGIAAILAGILFGRVGTDIGRDGVFTPDDYDIWRKVETLTPPDALVFSRFTGSNTDMRQGWFYYSAVSERQMYLGGWYSGPLRSDDPGNLSGRLKLNHAVLNGETLPQTLPLSRTYSSYYEVVEQSHETPKEHRLLYSNGRYALLEIPGTSRLF